MKRYDRKVTVWLTDIEAEMVERLADASNMYVEDFIRRLISLEVDKHQILKDSARGN